MVEQIRTVEEINERIKNGDAHVVTASEMKGIVAELGAEKAAYEVDVVTTGTFGAMCSSGLWMNFGHSEPPMKMSRVWLNDVEAYAGVAAVDAYVGATQLSETHGMDYGGGHVIEDLLRGKAVHLRAEAYGTDCYPRKELSIDISLEEMNQAILSNPRNGYERYAVAVNTTERTLYTYMGKLLPDLGNATFSGAGSIAPILNDPSYRAIGIGARIFLGGAQGYIIGRGTQHSPTTGFGTLMVQGDLKKMRSEYLKGATMTKYGTTLFVGLGVPIPILDRRMAEATGITDDRIITNVFDYSQPTRSRQSLKQVTYDELKAGA
ncbi:MAG: homocysteine biosynthesis protein, partial [Candidatus Thorarchaeota archaeon]